MLRTILLFLSILSIPYQVQATELKGNIPEWVSTISPENTTEKTCLALAIYYEARGESIKGQRAVASVVVNRTRHNRFPKSTCEVIFQPGQFSFIRGRSKLNPVGAAWDRAMEIGNEFVETGISEVPYLYFTNSARLKGFRIGRHVFR